MNRLKKRIETIENKLNVGKEPVVVETIFFGETLPPDSKSGNTIVRHVRYEDIQARERLQNETKGNSFEKNDGQ